LLNYQRAEEIFHAKETIEVFYNKQSVWIHHLHPQKKTAQISNVNEEMMEVPIEDLKEGEVLQ